jgi:ArsR family transcriptional regulator
MSKRIKLHSQEKLKTAARVLKVVAHPVKLEILQLLSEKEKMDVSSLCEHIGSGCEISMMSHHLAKMRDNGILISEKSGKQVFYSIADKSLLKLLDCLEQCELI